MAANVSGFNLHSGAQYGPPMDMSANMGNYNFGNTMNPTPAMPTGGFDPGSTGTMPNNQITWNPGGSGMSGMPTVSPLPGGMSQTGVTTPSGTTSPTNDLWNVLGLPTSGQGNEWDFGRDLTSIYGKGTGSAIFQYLQRGAGFNSPLTDQAIQSQDAAMQREAMQGWGNIASILGQSGINPNSSVEALSAGQYFGDVTAKENAMAAQEYYNMWSQSSGQEASLLQSILGGSKEHQANKGGGWMDFLTGGLEALGGAALIPFSGGASTALIGQGINTMAGG